MLNQLFKTTEKTLDVQPQPVIKPTQKKQISVKAIHEDFMTVSDKVMDEVAAWGERENYLVDKGQRLLKLGFHGSKEAKQAYDLINKNSSRINIAYYAQFYPFNKFLSRDDLPKLLKKYGLICGEVRKYKGEIPDKNLIEMERFSLREEDYYEISSDRIEKNEYDELKKLNENFIRVYKSGDGREYYYKINFGKRDLLICATPDLMELDKYDTVTESGFIVTKDPIVLQQLKSGYLIVTAWGPEASDERVINGINN